MICDLIHNKIIKDTITEQFSDSIKSQLLPMIEAKYGDQLVGIQMYEDYISDKLLLDGMWHYPLTVITRDGCNTEWVRWQMSKKLFSDGVPYSYVGTEPLRFEMCDAPADFAARISGRSRCFEGGAIALRVEAVGGTPTFLSGKYSQTFIDEMARQLTPAISEAMSVSGLADSNIELTLVFAPETYMEHTSENVTYRRLLISDKSSAPRDLWIKWTRKNSATAYSVSDNVTSDTITFELGEDVPQKVREKEYRFLLRAGKDKYHNSMGRKNITEWRELIKRAIRRGELTKLEPVFTEGEVDQDIRDELTRVLGSDIPKSDATVEIPTEESAELDLMLSLARAAVEAEEKMPEKEGGDVLLSFDDEDEDDEEEPDELEKFYSDDDAAPSEGVIASNDEEAAELDEITKLALEALKMTRAAESAEPAPVAEPIIEVAEDEPVTSVSDDAGEFLEIDDEDALEDGEDEVFEADPDEDELSDIAALEPTEEDEPFEIALSDVDGEGEVKSEETPVVTAEEPEAPAVATGSGVSRAEMEANIRAELEAKIRLEYERRERERAEEEAARLRREQEQLRLENERLVARAKREREEWERREEERRAEEARLRAQIEQQLKAEAKERERLAEAARLAIEEQKRLEEEKARAEFMRAEEERRAAREAEERRIEAERQAEAERIRREAEERAANESAAAPDTTKYTYTSKLVKLLFRKSVDPNITSRIHEIIKATIEYYGKEKVYLKIKASVPDTSTVCLEFVQIPMEEMELLSNIIKVLGNSGLGIAKAIVE